MGKLNLLGIEGKRSEKLIATLAQGRVSVIFDVGANRGQSILRFRSVFPSAKIFSFEPVSKTYKLLNNRFDHAPSVFLFNLALSDKNTRGLVTCNSTSTGNRVLGEGVDSADAEDALLVTGDSFCESNGIDSIGVLKIDTEGHDFKVLEGFMGMLSSGRVKFIEVEASLSLENRKHVYFLEFVKYLNGFGYRLLGLFEQTIDLDKGELRRANLLFCSTAVSTSIASPLQNI